MKRVKIRFNLGRGVNYKKWKINHVDKSVEYLDPEKVQLTMVNCELVNNKKISQEIFNGSHKRICAWILCEKITIKKRNFNQTDLIGGCLNFNPRIEPNWVLEGINVDGVKIKKIESLGNKLFVI